MIEKNIRLQPHHSRDLLVGRRSDGRRPKYQPPGGGATSLGSGRDVGGSRNGGASHDRGGGQHQRAAQAAQAAAAANRAAEQKAAAEREMRATIAQAESNQREAERANQLAEARRLMTQPTTVDVPIEGPELIPGTTGPVTLDPYQQSYISPGQVDIKDRYQTGDYADLVKAPVDVGFQEALRKQQIATDLRQKQQDLAYGQFFRPQPVVEKPRTGIGGALKTMGKGILETALMPFLPKPVRTAWSGYKRAKQLEGLAKRTGILDKDIVPTLNLSNLTSTIDKARGRQFDPKDPIGWTGEQKRTKTFHEGEGGDKQQETTVQEAIAGKGLEEGQKMLGIDEIKKRYSLLQTTLNNGYYVDNKGRTIQLNDQQKAMLTNYISQIDDYLVNVDTRTMSAYGGRIDKPLTGRSRDI